ncbi:MAG: PIN domain-containing protein [Planctomycetaceae bacterium]|nr:PIN domain-containing protein [Planctomycetaceae bacterium]
MTKYVLDHSAITAVLRREPGHEKILPHLFGSMVSALTIAELLTTAASNGADLETSFESLKRLKLEIVAFTDAHAVRLANLVNSPKTSTLSQSELFVICLAMEKKATIVTTNRVLSSMALPVKIKQFGPRF